MQLQPMKHNRPLTAHLSLFCAEAMWGLMSPIGKDAMANGVDSLDLISFRVLGAAVLFWTASLFAGKERVPRRHIVAFAGAALLAVVFNQCLFTIGLSYTSPINASIVTTSMPIFAMLLSFFILREPITAKKAGGVMMGCAGAVILILTSMTAGSGKVGDIRGDLMCLGAQLSFALYLALFSPIVKRYSVFTVNKWMFLFATFFIWPFTGRHVLAMDAGAIATATWAEAAYVVVFGTFVSYLLMTVGQRTLRPTVVSVYNYVQPVISVAVSVATGLGVFTLPQAFAVLLVFGGVGLVTKSKSKHDIETQAPRKA